MNESHFFEKAEFRRFMLNILIHVRRTDFLFELFSPCLFDPINRDSPDGFPRLPPRQRCRTTA